MIWKLSTTMMEVKIAISFSQRMRVQFGVLAALLYYFKDLMKIKT